MGVNKKLCFDLNIVDFNNLQALNDCKVKTKGDLLFAFVPKKRALEIQERVGDGFVPLKNLKRAN